MTASTWLLGPAREVAPALLGALIVSEVGGRRVVVRVTEVEAYEGLADPGSHAFRGRTARNGSMFGPAGTVYVYRHMGLHLCANVVTGAPGDPHAVLLRAGAVVEGADVAGERRSRAGVTRTDVDLAQGPARLAVALGLTADDDGRDLLGEGPVRLVPARQGPGRPGQVARGARVGVSGAGGDGVLFPWRFWTVGDPTVSAYRRAGPRRAAQAGRARPVRGARAGARGTAD